MKFSTMRFAFAAFSVFQLCMTLGVSVHCVAPIAIFMACVCTVLVLCMAVQTETDAFYLRVTSHIYAMCTASKIVGYSVDTCGHTVYPLGALRIVACLFETCVACEFLLRIWLDVYLHSTRADIQMTCMLDSFEMEGKVD